MTLALIAILIVFFAFGSQMALNYLAARAAYAFSADRRNNVSIIVLLVYLNIWIFDSITPLFNDFSMTLLVRVAITEILMYGLSFLVVLIMSLFSRSESKYISIPAAFITSFCAIPVINFILNFVHNMLGLIIV